MTERWSEPEDYYKFRDAMRDRPDDVWIEIEGNCLTYELDDEHIKTGSIDYLVRAIEYLMFGPEN